MAEATPKTRSPRGPICPYCGHQHVERTAWGAGDYESTCQKCGRKFGLTIRVTRTYAASPLEHANA